MQRVLGAAVEGAVDDAAKAASTSPPWRRTRRRRRAYAEARTPYEAAVAAARDTYESRAAQVHQGHRGRPRADGAGAARSCAGATGRSCSKYQELCAVERQQVVDAGGLFILGTERHESRRIDNQLRGRAGRQGDPGASRFFLSLEDDLLRIFGAERIQGLMTRLGMEEGEPIEHRLITRAIANAQSKVEGHNFDVRKHLLEYDDVMNKQREVIYAQRREVLGGETLSAQVMEMTDGQIDAVVEQYAPPTRPPRSGTGRRSTTRCSSSSTCGSQVPEERARRDDAGGARRAAARARARAARASAKRRSRRR